MKPAKDLGALRAATPRKRRPVSPDCHKCGGETRTIYCAREWHYSGDEQPPHAGEHFHRYCQFCHYEWIDMIPSQQPPAGPLDSLFETQKEEK